MSLRAGTGATPTAKPLRVLLVEDSEDDARLVLRAIPAEYATSCERVQDATSMRAALDRGAIDLIISDWAMPRFDAPAAIAVWKKSGLDLPFLVVSGTVGEESAVAAMRAGAHDFLLKSNLVRLGPAIDRELREAEARRAHRRAEEELRLSEARYRMLFDCSPLPMWVYDVRTFAFLAVNEAAIRHYRYTRQELATMTLDDLRPAEDVRALQDGAVADAADGRIWRHRKKDGTIIQVEINAHDLEFEGISARLVLANDVTERLLARDALRKSEDLLRHAQKMEAVGRLAGGVAHDFNNILSVILSYSSLLLEDLVASDPHRADVTEIEAAARRAADLTRQLLMFSRHEAFESRTLDLNDVISGMDKMLRRVVREDVLVEMRSTGALDKVKADRGQIEQVMMNLVVNARDAMPAGGKITIETANVEIDEARAREQLGAKAGPHVMIAVSDTGSGMDRATRARIFEPFFTTKAPGKGTGLGLATVFGIVQRYDGSIWVYSELGRGTTFKLFFPSYERAEGARDTRRFSVPPRRTSRGSETVLLVEDEAPVRGVAGAILRKSGYHVIEASDAGEALQICEGRDTPIHLLLTDMVMPHASGAELAERARASHPDMRVLFMSGYAPESILGRGGFDSNVAFLQKPLTPDVLSRKVRDVLDT